MFALSFGDLRVGPLSFSSGHGAQLGSERTVKGTEGDRALSTARLRSSEFALRFA